MKCRKAIGYVKIIIVCNIREKDTITCLYHDFLFSFGVIGILKF
jgi:hypothetical protein